MSAQLRILVAVGLITIVVLAGAAGFALVEGWSLGESLYMAVITVSTVGYGEVRPLSAGGRALTVILIVIAVATLGFSMSTINLSLLEGHLARDLRRRRMDRRLHKLSGHHIICGGGKFGREVAAELKRAQVSYVVVDLEPQEGALAGETGVLSVQGDAGNDATLREAGIDRAAGLVAALPHDDSNLFVVLTARQLKPDLTIITQANESRSIEKLQLAGANRVISPYRIVGRRMASALLRPTVADFMDEALDRDRTALQIEEVHVPEHSPLLGQSIRAAKMGDATGASVVAIHGPDGIRVNPTGSATLAGTTVRAHDVLVAVGTEQQLDALRRFVG